MTTTQNLHLPQFEATDRIMMEDFNAAFAAIDSAIANAGSKLVTGNYRGDNESVRNFELGFAPRAVLLIPDNAATLEKDNYNFYVCGGLATAEQPIYAAWEYKSCPAITLTETGFTVYYASFNVGSTTYRAYTNHSDKYFHYIAIG